MARLFSSGFELGSIVNGVELSSAASFGSTQVIETTNIRSGAKSLKITDLNSFCFHDFSSSQIKGPVYYRVYIYITAAPTVQRGDILFSSDGADGYFGIDLGTDLKLVLYDVFNGVDKVTSASALNLNQWYRIELNTDTTTISAVTADARIDGVSFGTATVNFTTGPAGQGQTTLCLGNQFHSPSSMIYYIDDIAINDSTGSFQNSFPGAGQIIHLKPSAAGDNNTFTVAVGGTAGVANNFTRVKEVTPDDATTYNADAVGGDTDDFNIDDTPASIGASDTINVVSVGLRYSALVAALESSLKVRVKKAAAGTVSKSAAITPNTVAWDTNANANPRNYPITLYQDPDAGSWTKATLDTAQIGYEISTGNTNSSAVSTVWMLVDSTPAAVAANTWIGSNLTTLKVG